MTGPALGHVKTSRPRIPQFPPHNAPRVWFLTNGAAPISLALCRKVLDHGDYVVLGLLSCEYELHEDRSQEFKEFIEDAKATERWGQRLRIVGLDSRIIGQTQSAVADAIEGFGRIDILVGYTTEAVIGCIEELGQDARTLAAVREQFEYNFFANVNIIKAVLPHMREKKNGHIIVLTGTTGHLGTPGLGMYCASQWAIEGYCDSIAYEVAPFNIKVTIVQPNLEINVLTNRITSVPPMDEYSAEVNPAPLSRDLLSGLLDKFEESSQYASSPSDPDSMTDATSPDSTGTHSSMGDLLAAPTQVTSIYPPLTDGVRASLIEETVHTLTAIGGHDNPPARHIVGFEGVTSVKEKLKTVSEELEDFIEVSNAVDIDQKDLVGAMSAEQLWGD